MNGPPLDPTLAAPTGPGRRTLSPAWADRIVLGALLVSGVIFVRVLPQYADLSLWDETSYLERGLHLVRDGLPSAQYGPFYSVYLWLLSLVIADPMQIAYANQMLVTILLPPAFFLLLRAARVSLGVAWPLAAFSLLSYANLHLDTKLAHLTLIVLMLAATAALRAPSLAGAVRWLVAGTFLASYFRPENFLAFLLLLPVWLGAEIRAPRRAPAPFPWRPVLLALVLLLLLARLGAPAFTGGGGRELLAFSQHYAIRWVEWNHSALNPGYDYAQIVTQAFGPVTSVTQAFRANPPAFLHHLTANVADLFTQSPKIFLLHFQLPAWIGGGRLKPWDGLALLLALFTLAILAWRRHRAQPAANRHYLLLLPLLVPPALSVLLIFPKYPYVLALVFLGVAIILAHTHARVPSGRPWLAVVLGGALLQLGLTPSLAQTEFTRRTRPVQALVMHLRGLHLRGELHVLETDGGYNVYLGPTDRMVRHFEKQTGFEAFRHAHDINVIIASDYLERQDVRFKDDPEWQQFLHAPGDAGFVRLPLPAGDRWLYVRRDVLPPS